MRISLSTKRDWWSLVVSVSLAVGQCLMLLLHLIEAMREVDDNLGFKEVILMHHYGLCMGMQLRFPLLAATGFLLALGGVWAFYYSMSSPWDAAGIKLECVVQSSLQVLIGVGLLTPTVVPSVIPAYPLLGFFLLYGVTYYCVPEMVVTSSVTVLGPCIRAWRTGLSDQKYKRSKRPSSTKSGSKRHSYRSKRPQSMTMNMTMGMDTQYSMSVSTANQYSDTRDSDEASVHRLNFDEVWGNANTRRLLHEHMQAEFCAESFHFMEYVESRQLLTFVSYGATATPDASQFIKEVAILYNKFIAPDAPFVVNLPSAIAERLAQLAKPPAIMDTKPVQDAYRHV
ncbi:hypothetical protein KIPB_011111, partial [Kipferlia bialata]|eukprot:g11111.t1